MRCVIVLAALGLLGAPGCRSDAIQGASADAAIDLVSSVEDGAVADAAVDAALPGLPGQPCAGPADCRSSGNPLASLHPTACIPAPGWPGGYCVDFCTLAPQPVAPPRLLRADCPAGSVCLPRWFDSQQIERAEIGACLKECDEDRDCRVAEGYYCRREFWTGAPPARMTLQNGYCAPAHCATRGCPTSFNCGC